MATEVKIPEMGESISSGILAAWHVKDGDFVQKGQILYELETDKITSEGTAEVGGVISIQVEADEEVDIGQVIASIDESVVDTTAEKESNIPKEDAGVVEAVDSIVTTDASIEARAEPVETLSPAARKAAEETGVDIVKISGSGKDGRVMKSDIIDASKNSLSEEAETSPASSSEPAKFVASLKPSRLQGGREIRKKMSPLRRKIAERLVVATQEAAMLTTFNEVDMSAVINLRKENQDRFIERHGIKLGFMSFFTKAVTHALQSVPEVNARIEGNEVVTQQFYDIGVAVGTDKGLMVPVLRDCNQKGFAEIESDIISYAKAARDGKIQMSDLEGGVFTISNGGIYGSMLSTPIINYPQPAILGLHNITERAIVINGEIVARPMMYLALSYDHRLIDGKEAVTFLVKVKEAIEDPTRLLFGI
ncbi:MAG: 2-oxoglutarate dehydrogenase complex dihydrolipoyllysine-residue succinyltransferase [Verrucomicrobiota bacterium]|nr:2-oxoglutarate dehydrogenase complex dihydrolipoyllysine-residue succinyltransferase [Verrucomicrobiota bacterium]